MLRLIFVFHKMTAGIFIKKKKTQKNVDEVFAGHCSSLASSGEDE